MGQFAQRPRQVEMLQRRGPQLQEQCAHLACHIACRLLQQRDLRMRFCDGGSRLRCLQQAIEDVEEFRERLERIERGDDNDLKARIRCRWKADEAKIGRPGPYAPNINDGVKVNVRPFQELALLAAPVIKKWD
jgi:hypothetical protein